MRFGEAINSVLFKNYFNLEGKATRSEYWWFMLFFLIVSFVSSLLAGIVAGIVMGPNLNVENFTFYYTIIFLAVFLLPLFGLNVRRFHDAGRSTNEAIIVFILVMFSQLAVPIGGQDALIPLPDSFITPVWIIFGTTFLYSLYIAVKKSVES